MATRKQTQAARRNVKKAATAAAVAQRKRSGGSSPKTRAELYEEAKRRNLRGRSKMGRDELARALGRRWRRLVAGGRGTGEMPGHAPGMQGGRDDAHP